MPLPLVSVWSTNQEIVLVHLLLLIYAGGFIYLFLRVLDNDSFWAWAVYLPSPPTHPPPANHTQSIDDDP